MALAGAELLIYPTAIGSDPMESHEERNLALDAWVTIQRSHAISNSLPLISANRVGFEHAPGNKGNAARSSGAPVLSAAPRANSSPGQATIRKKSSRRKSTSTAPKWSGVPGRS